MGRESQKEKKLRLADSTDPKIRKTLHKVMQKHINDGFYLKVDLINKILRKLKCDNPTANEKTRIRNLVNKWIDTNKPSKDEVGDSKNGLLTGDSKKNVLSVAKDPEEKVSVSPSTGAGSEASTELEKNNEKSKDVVNHENQAKASDVSQSQKSATDECSVLKSVAVQTVIENEDKIPPAPPALCIKCCQLICEKSPSSSSVKCIDTTADDDSVIFIESKVTIPLIDLTSDEVEVKKEDISIDQEMYDIMAVICQDEEPLKLLRPTPVHPIPTMSQQVPSSWLYGPYQNYNYAEMYNNMPYVNGYGYCNPYSYNYGPQNNYMHAMGNVYPEVYNNINVPMKVEKANHGENISQGI